MFPNSLRTNRYNQVEFSDLRSLNVPDTSRASSSRRLIDATWQIADARRLNANVFPIYR